MTIVILYQNDNQQSAKVVTGLQHSTHLQTSTSFDIVVVVNRFANESGQAFI